MSKNVPDEKFYEFPEDHGACIVEIGYPNAGGTLDYVIVRDRDDLEALVKDCRKSTRLWIKPCFDAMNLRDEDHASYIVYVPNEKGEVEKAAY